MHGSVALAGGGRQVTSPMQLVPFGSDRAAIAGSYRIIIASCWNAPGLNHKPPATSNLLEMAVCSRSKLAWTCLSRHDPRLQTNSAPIRESCILPHVEHVLLPCLVWSWLTRRQDSRLDTTPFVGIEPFHRAPFIKTPPLHVVPRGQNATVQISSSPELFQNH